MEGFAFGNNLNQRCSSSEVLCDGTDRPDADRNHELCRDDDLHHVNVSVFSRVHMEENLDHDGWNRITGAYRDHNHYQFYVYGADNCGKTQ